MKTRWWLALIGGLTILLYLPVMRLGFLADFYWFPAMDFQNSTVGPNFVDFAAARGWWSQWGVDAWWASDQFRWVLWRPLSTWALQTQWRVFGADPLGYHLVSLGAYLLLLPPLWTIYRSMVSERTALLALALFAFHFSHLQTVWFHSNQHSLWSVLPALLGLVAHTRWRAGWKPGLPLSLLGMLLGLASGETALTVVPYWLPASRGSWKSLLPITVLVAAYLVAHHQLGYSTRGSLIYLDPAEGLSAFLAGGLARLPALVVGSFNVLPADLWELDARFRPLLLGVAAILMGQLAGLLRIAWKSWSAESRQAALFGLAGFFSLIPGMASFPGGRLLLSATIGSSLLLALLFQEAVQNRSRSYRLLLAPLLLVNLGMPLGVPLRAGPLGEMGQGVRVAAETAEIDATKPALVITLPSENLALNLLSARYVYDHQLPPPFWWLLSAAPADHRLSRLSANALRLEVVNHHMIGLESNQRLFKPAHWPVTVGDHFVQNGLEVDIEAVDADGPTQVRYQFPEALEHYQVLAWQQKALRHLTLPAVGETVVIPWSPTPCP